MSGYELVLKATLLCVTGLAAHISLSPPNPPVKDQNCSVPDTLFENFVQSITFLSKVPYFLMKQLRHHTEASHAVRNMGGGDMGHYHDIDSLHIAYTPASFGSHSNDATHLSRHF
jgi:hypothetical protein